MPSARRLPPPVEAAARAARRVGALLRRRWPVALLFAAALVLLSHQYFTTIYHGDVDEPRGDGTYHPLVAVQDGHKMYLQAMSAVFDRDLDITDEVEAFGLPGYEWKTDSGRPVWPHAIGPILVWTPTLAAAHGASKLAADDVPSHGYTLFHQRFVFYTSVLAAWLAAFLGYRSARRLLGDTWAAPVAAIAILFGTNLSYYAVQRPDYGHALSAAACALFLASWVATWGDWRWRRFALLGALLGLAGLMRIANLGLGVVVAVEIGAHMLRPPEDGALRWRRDLGLVARGAAAALVSLLAMTPQFLVWKYHYESGLFTPPHGGQYVHLGRPMLPEFLFSSHNGYLYTHPLAYASLGLFAVPRRWRALGLALFLAVSLQVYLNSCVWDWWGMGSYGARRMVGASFCVMIGLAAALQAGARLLRRARVPTWPRRALGVALCAWFVVWNQSYADASRSRRKSERLAMCCDEVPERFAALAEPIYERIGNPFALPASLPFSWRHDVPVKTWEVAVTGKYAARPNHHEFREGKVRLTPYAWNIPGVNFDPWLAGGMGPRQSYRKVPEGAPRNFRWTVAERGSVFLPLFLPTDYRVRVDVHANLAPTDAPVTVGIDLNGEPLVEREVGFGWQTIHFTIPAERVVRGTNRLTFRAPAGPPRTGGAVPPPPGGARAALAVSQLDIFVDRPVR